MTTQSLFGDVARMTPFPHPRMEDIMAMDDARPRILVVLEASSAGLAPVAANDESQFDLRVETFGISAFARAGSLPTGLDALIVEVDPESAESLEAFQTIAREQSNRLAVIGAVRDLTVSATRLVLRAGAADVLRLPFSEADLAAVEFAAMAPIGVPAGEPARKGRIVSFMGARGGSGVTALATQMGLLWAARARVCLIDLDVQFGNAALYLDLAPQLGLLDALSAGSRLDGELLASVSVTHESGLDILAAPADVAPLDSVSVAFVEALLATAAQRYDIVLIDLPKNWVPWSVRALELSDLTVLVTARSVSGLHQTKRQLAVIEANGLADRVKILINRVEHPMIGKIDLSETQVILGKRIDFAVADDAKSMNAAVDLGKPLAKVKSGSRVEKDLKAVIASLVAAFEQAAPL